MSAYQISDFLISSLIAFLIAFFVRGSILRMSLCAALGLALETLAVQVLVGHRLNFWDSSYLLGLLGALAVGVGIAYIIRRRKVPL